MQEKEQNSDTPKQCDSCGGILRPEKMKIEEFEGGKLYVINDAPALTCQSCGEVWVPETIINELEQMIALTKKRKLVKLHRKSKIIKKRPSVKTIRKKNNKKTRRKIR